MGEPITGEPVRRVRALLEGCNARLFETLCPTEFRHMTVARFCCVRGEPPRTAKGTVQRGLLEAELGDLIARLVGDETRGGGVHHTDRAKYLVPAFVRLTSPRRGQLLRLARLDKRFTGGKGDLLTYTEDGQQHTVIDLVGGFGTNLLGHRHPEVVAAATDFIAGDGVFLSDQGSLREPEATLADRLGRFVGRQTGDSYVVRFGSTGSEAVEMAIAHALLEQERVLRRHERRLKQRFGATHPDLVRRCIDENRARWARRRPVLLAIEGGYHGNSLAARCTSGRVRRWEPFEGAVAIETVSLPPDGAVDVEATLAESELTLETLAWQGDDVVQRTTSVSRVFAAIAEPVLGEGGVRTVSSELLEALANRPFPLISDEIQCGLGRCGTAVASMPVRADYYLLGKALGGGIAKISALLVESSRYLGRFDALYGSTFAGDAFSSTIASCVLDVIEREEVVLRCARLGQHLRAELERLRAKHPALLRRVGGRGMLLGVELDPDGVSDSMILRALEAQRRLGLVVAAYLLEHHGLRLLPTLSAPNVLRIEPSAFLDDDAMAKLVNGLDDVCRQLASRDLTRLLGFLVRDDLRTTPVDKAGPPVTALSARVEAPPERAVRVAFINHFAHPETELVAVEPSLSALPRAVRRTLFHRLAEATELKPLVAFRRNLFCGRVNFASIVVPADVAMLEHWHRSGDHRLVRRRIQEAVDLAGQLGCEVITLGGYTSIVTDNGRTVTPPPGARVTTGNTLTVAVGGERIRRACAALGIDPGEPDAVLAVVGATGNIGRALSHNLLTGPGRFRRAVLMGRSSARLESLRHELSERCSADADDGGATPPQIEISTDPAALKNARVIAVATNTNAPIVHVGHLRSRRAVLVADLSVPKAVSREARKLPNVRVIPLAGTVAVPGESGFRIAPHIEPGTAFCCAAEALLLGLDGHLGREWSLRGAIEPAAVRALGAAAERAGFLDRLCEAPRHAP
jgi:acetylornithine/succinyldiaminopimelate/putrescine aminotransferase/predicted amino acid dehydrogenase